MYVIMDTDGNIRPESYYDYDLALVAASALIENDEDGSVEVYEVMPDFVATLSYERKVVAVDADGETVDIP